MSNNECEGCENGLESMFAKHDELMKKYGWIVHYVPDKGYPFHVNIHTHGFPEKFKHLDMQICASLSQENAHGIMQNIARRLGQGKPFRAGKKYNDIIEGYPILICPAMEGDREVLRIVFPDKSGRFNTEFSKTQMKDIISLNQHKSQ